MSQRVDSEIEISRHGENHVWTKMENNLVPTTSTTNVTQPYGSWVTMTTLVGVLCFARRPLQLSSQEVHNKKKENHLVLTPLKPTQNVTRVITNVGNIKKKKLKKTGEASEA